MPVVSGIGVVQDAATAIITSTPFPCSPEEFLYQARQGPVEITRHCRREFVLMRADHYDWLRAAAQRRHRTAEAADIVIDAVERAEMNAGLMPLDALLG